MAFDSFIKIGDIPGESSDDKHKDWIEIMSFNWGASQPVTVGSGLGGLSGGGANLSDFSFVKKVDKSSPKLLLSCCKGDPIAKIEFECRKSIGDKHVYLKYTFENAMISSVRPGGSAHGGDDVPLEEVSFAYAKFENVYTPVDQTGKPQGNVSVKYDLTTNK
jgi:type VI secretion system secreted protein Hcp